MSIHHLHFFPLNFDYLVLQVGNTGYEDSAYSKSNGSGDDHLSEKQSAACIHFHEQQCENRSAGVPLMDANENNLVLSGGSEASNCSFSIETSSYKSSSLLEAGEGWVDSAVANSDSEKVTRFEVGTVGQDQSTSILEKLFNNALAVNGVDSPNFIEVPTILSNDENLCLIYNCLYSINGCIDPCILNWFGSVDM